MVLKACGANNNKVVRVDCRANKTVLNLSKNDKSKKLSSIPNIEAIWKPTFLTFYVKKVFIVGLTQYYTTRLN